MSSAGIVLRRLAALALLCAVLGTAGCSTHTMQLKYEPTGELVAPKDVTPVVTVGSIRDDRNEESTWFGAIRGGYGNPLKKLHADQAVSAVVTGALSDALRRRGLLAPSDSATLRIDGTLTEFQCNYYWNRDAHVHLSLSVVDLSSNNVIFTQTYKTDTQESGVGAGIFGNVDHLAAFTQQTMSQTIDKALADPALLAALADRKSAPLRAASDRLKQIEALRRDGLISDTEYEAKRKEILSEI
jgi:uncharacterized lipoprotein YajG